MEQSGMKGNSFSSVKESIAEKLERAAGSLGSRTEQGRTLGPYGQQASEWLHQSAGYIRNFDVERTDRELRNKISSHPGRSMLIGMAAGLLVGMLIRRR